jgi:hypothetical protein
MMSAKMAIGQKGGHMKAIMKSAAVVPSPLWLR